jgi:hypothetical protein
MNFSSNLGIQMTENCHPHYLVAKKHNVCKLDESRKIKLEVELTDLNLNLYKGQSVFVNFMVYKDSGAKSFTGNSDDAPKSDDTGIVMDRVLTGS